MARSATLKIDIIADAKGASKGLDEAGRGFSKMGAAAKLAGVAVAAMAGKFLKDSVTGYREHNKIAAITAQVIKTTGGAAKISAKSVEKLADSIERKTGVDGDQIQAASNLLLTFTNVRNEVGKNNDIFNRATSIATDMSVALGTDAAGSAIQLGKALNDPIKGVSALSRVGVSFTEQQKKQIKVLTDSGNVLGAQKIILAELGKEFGGAAEAAATPADKLRASYHRLQDTVGAALVPALDKMAVFLNDRIMPPIQRMADKYGPKLTTVMGDLGTKLSDLFSGKAGSTSTDLSSLSDSVQKIAPAFKDAAASMPSFGDGLSVAATFAKFLAKHTDKLAKIMPILVGALVAYAAAQVISNTVGRKSLIGFALQTIGTFALAASNRSLAASMRAQTAATLTSNTAGKASLLTTARSTVATIASTVAQKAAAVASKAWAAVQWLLNAAMTANPIGLVVAAIALLVAGIILAYKHSETFRAIVDAAFRAVGVAVEWMVDKVQAAFGWVKDHWPLILGIMTGPIGLAIVLIVKHFDAIKAKASAILDAVVGFFTGLPGRIARGVGDLFSSIKDKVIALKTYVSDKVGDIVGYFTGMPGRLAGKFSGMFSGISTAFKSAINAIIGAWNNLSFKIPGFDPPGPGPKFGGVTINFPNLPYVYGANPIGMVAPGYAGVGGLGGAPIRGLARGAWSGGGGWSMTGGGAAGGLIVMDRRTIDARVTVHGALDPVAVAAQVERIQRDAAVRLGRATAYGGAAA